MGEIPQINRTQTGATDTRDARGRFVKGVRGGPGRRKGERDFRTELVHALRIVEKSKCQSVFVRAWELAWADETMMSALLRKLLPDLSHQTGQSPPTQVNVIYGHQQRVQVVEPIPAEDGDGAHG